MSSDGQAGRQVELRLASHDFTDAGESGLPVRLGLAAWQRLLDRLDATPSGPACVTCADTGWVVKLYEDSDLEPWRQGSYAEGVVRRCPACSPPPVQHSHEHRHPEGTHAHPHDHRNGSESHDHDHENDPEHPGQLRDRQEDRP